VPVGQLKSLDNVSYNSFEVTGHDGINEDRVYIENVNKEIVNTK
jgi:hypothetical protein